MADLGPGPAPPGGVVGCARRRPDEVEAPVEGGRPHLIKEADPELEKLLDEEEIARRTRQIHEARTSAEAD
jgi:hypothetical protein